MMIYLALLAAAVVLFWVIEPKERERLFVYAVSLGGGTAFAFLVFASNDNWNNVCDALSPVWLSDALVGGALLFAMAWVTPGDWKRRLALAAGAGVIVAAFHALTWPHCLQRLEGVSPEVERLWLSHVKEARPFYRHGWRLATLIIALPVTGAVGWGMMAWWNRRDPLLLRRVIGAAVPGIVATLLLFWQTRTGPASQMMAVIGGAAIIWFLIPYFWNSRSPLMRI